LQRLLRQPLGNALSENFIGSLGNCLADSAGNGFGKGTVVNTGVFFRGSQQVGQKFFFLRAEGTLIMEERSRKTIHHFFGNGRQSGTS
jgi:hypothetical protein